ncbi:hypothetical protein BC833DRAFT_582212 [Globomyces pollinis-pini]|nr:hypothetical protein BC833DRAFT_582212 [Globomyces pollinis-pini]
MTVFGDLALEIQNYKDSSGENPFSSALNEDFGQLKSQEYERVDTDIVLDSIAPGTKESKAPYNSCTDINTFSEAVQSDASSIAEDNLIESIDNLHVQNIQQSKPDKSKGNSNKRTLTAADVERSMKALGVKLATLKQIAQPTCFDTSTPEFSDELSDFRNIKKLHYNLTMMIDDYDEVADCFNWLNEEKLHRYYEKSLQRALHRQKKDLTEHYESKMKHDACNELIDKQQEQLCAFINDNQRLELENKKLLLENQNLRIFKSNAIDEQKLLLIKVSKQKFKIQKLMKSESEAKDSSSSDSEVELNPINDTKTIAFNRKVKSYSNPEEDAIFIKRLIPNKCKPQKVRYQNTVPNDTSRKRDPGIDRKESKIVPWGQSINRFSDRRQKSLKSTNDTSIFKNVEVIKLE